MAGDTRKRILDVAERLFADSGFASTSLRDITAEAGVNLAAVNYHFGSKEALLGAILERRIRPMNNRRIVMLNKVEAEAGAGGATVARIVAAFVDPAFKQVMAMGSHRRQLLKLLGQLHTQATPDTRKLFFRQFDEVRIRFTASFQRALPDIDSDEVARRVMYVVGSMSYIMMWAELPDQTRTATPDKLRQSLIDFASAGMAAPETAPTRTAAPATLPAGTSMAAHGGDA